MNISPANKFFYFIHSYLIFNWFFSSFLSASINHCKHFSNKLNIRINKSGLEQFFPIIVANFQIGKPKASIVEETILPV